jgi:hypothetical protein
MWHKKEKSLKSQQEHFILNPGGSTLNAISAARMLHVSMPMSKIGYAHIAIEELYAINATTTYTYLTQPCNMENGYVENKKKMKADMF